MSDNRVVRYVDSVKSKKVRVWGKGQLTIPVEIRERLGIKEDSYLEVFQIGKAIVAIPERLLIKELADNFQKEMFNDDIDLEKLLLELREGNHAYETE
ncbi:AbrB/MazE/SpoVT family DNA-binding domain-containing protein [Desulfoscipio gibsoniae]|uniref:Looped-hinge helix DNA binding domain, AbrB family n=1 Tax=Desulfoscipio gibsoniae DSM 7213 TaxID=767817 RepID=R4KJU9_9FIRM|nr:AbrB/MazE/SpoVT family DNA-binding domain-containing protein [Desulfoscipio gibsoniae]AGL01882.1 looped-hinge helix DNA binding domain, AbrB family [Desulfoscipio gibsoniae DSM 7213]